MKKLIARLFTITLLPAAFVVGCSGNNPPLAPTAVVPVTTVVPTVTFQPGPAMVDLKTAANYAVLSYDGITNSGSSTICGNIGSYPMDFLDGGIELTCGGIQNLANDAASIAQDDLSAALCDIASRENSVNFTAGDDIGGQTLFPGLYSCEGNLSITSNNLILDGLGNENAVFIFRVNGTLSAASNRSVLLVNGAKAANVFWMVSDCALGGGAAFAGNIMAEESVALDAGAVMDGRAFSVNVEVSLSSNTITLPTP